MDDRGLVVEATFLENDVRLFVYRHFVSECRAPTILEAAKSLGVGREQIDRAFNTLEKGHVLVLDPETGEIWMAMPFSAVPTACRVTVGESSWWAN